MMQNRTSKRIECNIDFFNTLKFNADDLKSGNFTTIFDGENEDKAGKHGGKSVILFVLCAE
jgi:hypothetical protein